MDFSAMPKKINKVLAESRSTKPIIIVLGMAGSGKTTFVKVKVNIIQVLCKYLQSIKKKAIMINLDPAVIETGYTPDFDIRESVKYKDVMRDYKLGPNGAIMTSLNIYCTHLSSLIDKIKNPASDHE
ncbi:GPN-loop GTPase 1 [Thelohanellus kitauei]|uniref:GPN-loop GTPase n=1 Tax=Thelohanellus kitauei TaxID=669202 RepID=A0A0C2M8V5_THEKT|nr:GPN-loop GTPase 1 [Thelohanellus kitauei]